MAIKILTGQTSTATSSEHNLNGPCEMHGIQFTIPGATTFSVALDTKLHPDATFVEAYEHVATADEITNGNGKITITDVLGEIIQIRITANDSTAADVYYSPLRRW